MIVLLFTRKAAITLKILEKQQIRNEMMCSFLIWNLKSDDCALIWSTFDDQAITVQLL